MALSFPTLPGDIDHLIADDHAIVEWQFQHLESGRGDRRTLADQIGFELALHAFAEETVLYPTWLELGMQAENADARGEHDQMCNKTGAIVATPDYRRAPEAVFPASHDDVLTAYRWTVANATEFGDDPTRIRIGGGSVGGTMSAATVLQLAQAGEPTPLAQVCACPLTTGEQFGESMTDAADSQPLNRALLSWMALLAFQGKPDAVDRTDEQRALMPGSLVITDEWDVLRSQGQQFAADLEPAGVATTHRYHESVMHEFFGASAVLDKAEQAQQEVARHFVAAFGSGPGSPGGATSTTSTSPDGTQTIRVTGNERLVIK